MKINGEDKKFDLKIEKDKITLIGMNDIVEMSLEEANMVGRILSDQSSICINILNAKKCLNMGDE